MGGWCENLDASAHNGSQNYGSMENYWREEERKNCAKLKTKNTIWKKNTS